MMKCCGVTSNGNQTFDVSQPTHNAPVIGRTADALPAFKPGMGGLSWVDWIDLPGVLPFFAQERVPMFRYAGVAFDLIRNSPKLPK